MEICGDFLPRAMLIIILIYNLSSSNKTYVEGPTYTETLLKNPTQTTFPEIAIGPLDNGYKKGILKVVICMYNSLIYIPTLYLVLTHVGPIQGNFPNTIFISNRQTSILGRPSPSNLSKIVKQLTPHRQH